MSGIQKEQGKEVSSRNKSLSPFIPPPHSPPQVLEITGLLLVLRWGLEPGYLDIKKKYVLSAS